MRRMRRENIPSPNMLWPIGTHVVTRVEIQLGGGAAARPRGTVGEIVKTPVDPQHSYRVRFADGAEAALKRGDFTVLKHAQRAGLENPDALGECGLFDHVIYRCVIGSRAYGLENNESDTDQRGVYLPPADLHWSLGGLPEQLENDETQECYWELQKFLTLALKANPNVLECLYTPLVEMATPLAREMLDLRPAFLSRLIYQTYNGYVLSQFKKLEADLRNRGAIKWKHAMHLIRLLLAGVAALREGVVPVRVEAHRDKLLAIRRGETPWAEVNAWRLELHRQFEQAFAETKLPERPDYEKANAFLIKARRSMV